MPTSHVFNSQLQAATLRLIRTKNPELTLVKIEAHTGLTVHWLTKFQRSCGGSPAVDKVEKLYNYLSGKTLEL